MCKWSFRRLNIEISEMSDTACSYKVKYYFKVLHFVNGMIAIGMSSSCRIKILLLFNLTFVSNLTQFN